MRTLAIALFAMMVVLLTGLAEATTLTGTGSLPATTRDFSPVEKVGCGGPGRCPIGLHWVCGPHGRCGCVSCGIARPYVGPYVRPYRYRY
jgi:hypothetical protein